MSKEEATKIVCNRIGEVKSAGGSWYFICDGTRYIYEDMNLAQTENISMFYSMVEKLTGGK